MSLWESCCANVTGLVAAYVDWVASEASSQAIGVSVALSIGAYFLCMVSIERLKDNFTNSGLFGFDMGRHERVKVPESLGVVAGCVYLICLFIFIPLPFYSELVEGQEFSYKVLVQFLSAVLSVCCMILLGFADDVLELRWRHKLWLPTLASLPLLLVYFVNSNQTTVVIPLPLRPFIGSHVNLSFLYYIYMGMLAIFCTNAINILAGVNGLEAGQSLLISVSILLHNSIEYSGQFWHNHLFSIYLVLPYCGVCLALLQQNWYPARVFVGDTFCYFSGMLFAVVAILGHFSKTLLLFFIPQIFNFLFSVPQIFNFVPCPRHRLPVFNKKTGLRETSYFQLDWDSLNILGKFFLKLFQLFRLVDLKTEKGKLHCSNMTLICLVLKWFGPMHERRLTTALLLIQAFSSLVGFFIRYQVAKLFY